MKNNTYAQKNPEYESNQDSKANFCFIEDMGKRETRKMTA